MTTDKAGRPAKFHFDAIRIPFDRHDDLFQQQPGNDLAIFGRCRRGMPQRWKIICQR